MFIYGRERQSKLKVLGVERKVGQPLGLTSTSTARTYLSQFHGQMLEATVFPRLCPHFHRDSISRNLSDILTPSDLQPHSMTSSTMTGAIVHLFQRRVSQSRHNRRNSGSCLIQVETLGATRVLQVLLL